MSVSRITPAVTKSDEDEARPPEPPESIGAVTAAVTAAQVAPAPRASTQAHTDSRSPLPPQTEDESSASGSLEYPLVLPTGNRLSSSVSIAAAQTQQSSRNRRGSTTVTLPATKRRGSTMVAKGSSGLPSGGMYDQMQIIAKLRAMHGGGGGVNEYEPQAQPKGPKGADGEDNSDENDDDGSSDDDESGDEDGNASGHSSTGKGKYDKLSSNQLQSQLADVANMQEVAPDVLAVRQACLDGDAATVKRYFAKYGTARRKRQYALRCRDDDTGDTLVHLACRKDHVDIVRYLVDDASAGVVIKNKEEVTPLFVCCMGGSLECLRFLCSRMPRRELLGRCTAIQGRQYTPLLMAAFFGRLNVLQFLMKDCKVNRYQRDGDDRSALAIAVIAKQHHVVEFLLLDGDETIDHVDGADYNALFYAVLNNDIDMIKLLLAHGVQLDYYRRLDGRSAFAVACDLGYLDVIQLFLLQRSSFSVNRVDHDGYSPLHLALKGRHMNVIRVLESADCELGPLALPPEPESQSKQKCGKAICEFICCCGIGLMVMEFLDEVLYEGVLVARLPGIRTSRKQAGECLDACLCGFMEGCF